MISIQSSKAFLLHWNYQFPVDKWWRKKYNIPLFSEQHLQISQLDIALEYLEDKLYEELVEKIDIDKKKEKDYKRGELLNEQISSITEEEEEDLFDRISKEAFKK